MKDVQCYELFGGIALKDHVFSYIFLPVNQCLLRFIFSIKKCVLIVVYTSVCL